MYNVGDSLSEYGSIRQIIEDNRVIEKKFIYFLYFITRAVLSLYSFYNTQDCILNVLLY